MNPDPNDWSARLRELPELQPPPSLWLRTEAEYLARHPRRHRPSLGRWAIAASLLAAVPLAALLYSRQAPPIAAEQLIRIQTLDHELQRRIDEGASDAELAPLWEQRRALIEGDRRPIREQPDTIRI